MERNMDEIARSYLRDEDDRRYRRDEDDRYRRNEVSRLEDRFRSDKSTEELEWGELDQESFDFKRLSWNIPNVLSLPNIVGYKVQSEVFSLAGATWRLQMYPYGDDFISEGHMSLTIIRLHSHIPEHFVFSKLCFKTCNEREFGSVSFQHLFDSDEDEGGAFNFIIKSKLEQKKKFLTPNGVLTILCEMRTKKIDGIAKCMQVEPVESFLGSDNAVESSHDNQILGDFKKLFLDQEDCDIIINIKGKEFKAHKLILKARSPVLSSTFRHDMKEKSTGIINIDDCDPSVFSSFLSFLYCGDVENLSVENMFSLFTVADKYDVQCLRKICLEFIKVNLSVDTFCDTIQLALQHSEVELLNLSTDFFAKNLQEIIITVKWQSFLLENPIHSNELFIKALVPSKSLK